MRQGPRIYNLFPLLAGPVEAWHRHLERIAAMGFDWIFVNPFHYPGFSGSLYAVKDYYRLHPLLAGEEEDGDRLLADFVAAARQHGLAVMMDLVLNHTAKDSLLVERHPEWFAREADDSVRSPHAVDPDDPAKVTVWGDLAEIDYVDETHRHSLIAYWNEVVGHYAGLGFRGFRGDAAYKVPAAVWQPIIAAARERYPEATFFAETLGCRPGEVTALHDAGFDYIFNSSKWWDFRAPWLPEQYEAFRHIAPSIAFPESHDTERLSAELSRTGVREPRAIEALYRQRYLFAATFSTGVMMPMGFEYGFQRPLHVVETRPEQWEEPLFDLSDFVAEANAMKAARPALNVEGPQAWRIGEGAVALLRRSDETASADWALTLVNPDRRSRAIKVADALRLGAAPPGVEVTPGQRGMRLGGEGTLRLEPGEVRVFARAEKEGKEKEGTMTQEAAPDSKAPRGGYGGEPAAPEPASITIQEVYPEIDCGRHAVKREVGDLFEVWADIFKEGHDKIAAVLKVRRQDESAWREVPMQLMEPGLDRWRGAVRLEENARHLYTIEAWPDPYATWLDELGKKRGAGQKVALELLEGRALVEAARGRATGKDAERLGSLLADFDRAEGEEEQAAVLSSAIAQKLIARWPDRTRSAHYRELKVYVDRTAARFAAWYEMFPRSQGSDPNRGSTFAECALRLDEVKAMGFDVVYFVPIHPIGHSNRKGRNNALTAEPGEPGSPYAIGSEQGGHDSVHPELGTLKDFRAFVGECRKREMEVALDFAIQCSPDHPWLKQHPEWFEYRPDGSIKYAENPPKKYQDIVNVNFYGPHREALWTALRDVVLFWCEQGVRIFRVDNPHTKPVPFWRWMIREVQDRFPDALFLSEAFTRPKMLRMLAKVGFTQSYTYFTWRNFKGELTDYLQELTQGESKEYLRPNFFPTTPDILPPFLQSGGRPAFQIRFLLAATLSSVYGIYNGFELCEAAAVPGKEEYLDSEKYQYKVRDWNRPGNIKDYIAAVNRIRRENPALQGLKNLRFHHASDDSVLFYGKAASDQDNLILIAVNLDPFETHESELHLPLGDIGVGEDDPFEVEELLTGQKHLWRGHRQRVRLDPHENPAAIFRVKAWERVDYREPCF